jgi:hypothetical protein
MPLRSTLVPIAALLVAGAAFAQTPTQSIEVRGMRTDVRTLCPGIDNALHDALVKTAQDVAAAAVIDVRFQLAGTRIDSVSTSAGPTGYQRALKWAVRGLECDSGTPTVQTLAMRVRFVDPFDRSAPRAVALVEGAPAAR